jgi:hypothetical protein
MHYIDPDDYRDEQAAQWRELEAENVENARIEYEAMQEEAKVWDEDERREERREAESRWG